MRCEIALVARISGPCSPGLLLSPPPTLVGSLQCDAPEVASLPAITSSRMGDIPVADIDAAFSACVAAVKEMQALGTALAVPLVEYGESGWCACRFDLMLCFN